MLCGSIVTAALSQPVEAQHMVHPAEQARHVRQVHAQAYLEIPPLPFTILDSL